MSSRRRFLKTSLALGGGALVGGGLWYKKTMHTRAIAKQLVYYLDYPEIAVAVGRSLLDADESLHNISLEQLINKLLQDIGTSKAQLPEITRNQLLEKLHRQVRTNFINEQIVLVNGWLLSRTDARVCSVLTLLVA